ncbi:transposase B of [Microscilla marina ATCC 23134]|uniref:Transposase B of n=1 Tax=Microscilla marina ATCC 23134 TaxID=313606 RepID=A2A0H9_MICM2|nr:transposase B of [Microscilla marina ATCC 23134]
MRQVGGGTLPEGRLLLVKQPSYSPELNASEQVWNYLKNVIMKNQVFPTVKKLGRKLKQILREFKNKKSIIKKFFENPDVAFY